MKDDDKRVYNFLIFIFDIFPLPFACWFFDLKLKLMLQPLSAEKNEKGQQQNCDFALPRR
jgi:hypothetical protein